MALIEIFANGIRLDFVNETLSVKTENNAFITDFKVSYNTFPFLVIENRNAKAALGPRDITSINKKTSVPVVVLFSGQRYTGTLTVSSYLPQYRKCNLKFGSAILPIMDKKCADFLPVHTGPG